MTLKLLIKTHLRNILILTAIVGVFGFPMTGMSQASRNIALSVKDVPVKQVIDQIADQAGLSVSWSRAKVALEGNISVVLKDVSVDEALAIVLKETAVEARVSQETQTIVLVPRESPDSLSDGRTGSVVGKIADSATGNPIRGATVTLVGTRQVATTDDQGRFILRNVVSGNQSVTVRSFGYRSATRAVTVSPGKPSSLSVNMVTVPTSLADVVTTATGTQQKLEIGSDVTTLNVDSIMSVAPIASVTDLLEARVPGMVVQRTSGTPGDPARIRLRGTSSIYGNNDPIIIVDGIRMYSEQSDERNINTSESRSYATPSPLDQIDPNSIETIEVFKGPSASALYGSDAANGVIVVTTKRGQAGPPSWFVALNAGVNYMPGSWPETKYVFVTPIQGGAPKLCLGYCGNSTVDSVVWFQALNNPRLTAIGTGSSLGGSVTMSGGSQDIQYSLTASGANEVGLLKLPKIEEERYLRFQGEAPPKWMRRPDQLGTQGVNGRFDIRVNPNTTMGMTVALTQSAQHRSSMSASGGTSVSGATRGNQSAIGALQSMYVDLSQLAERPMLSNPYERVVANTINWVTAFQVRTQPFTWLPLTGTVGMTQLTQSNEMSLASELLTGEEAGGRWGGSTKATSGVTGTLQATNIPYSRILTMSAGLNFVTNKTNDQSGSFRGIPEGVIDPSFGEDSTRNKFTRMTSERKSFGWFIEPRLNLNSRFFAVPGFRLDNNGLSGKNAKFNGLPKMSLSYVASDEPFFPFRNVIDLFRIRAAFGIAGVQPNAADLNRLYIKRDAGPYGEVLALRYLGNTKLRPERGVELEGGFDAELLQNRLSLNITYFQKQRKDAIVSNNYTPSVDGGGRIRMNVGDLSNSGTEISAQAQVLERRSMSVNLNGSFSRLRSKVVKLSDDAASIGFGSPLSYGGVQYVVGYPVEGLWLRPILGYADLDGNGWLSSQEVVLGGTPSFIGSNEPSYQASFNPNMSLFNGRVTVNGVFSYVGGQLQVLDADNSTYDFGGTFGIPPFKGTIEQGVDGFDRQVALVAINQGHGVGFVQKVNVLRMQSISASTQLGTKATRALRARSAVIAIQGSNLGIWTNYLGKDPNVNGVLGGRGSADLGQLPQPRTWHIRLSLGY